MGDGWADLKILISGCGSIGKRHARVLTSLGLKNLWVCDANPDQMQALQAETPSVTVCESYESGLAAKPDAVFIMTPPKVHIPMILQALDAGCHVFCEKPLSDSMEGVEDLKRRVASQDRKVMVGLCFRYHDGLVKAKKKLEAGEIGRLVSVRALMGEHLPDVRPDYRNLFSAKYSGAFDLMHDIDLTLWYADQPVSEVKCIYGNFSDIGIEAPDVVEMLIEFQDPRQASGEKASRRIAARRIASVHLDFFQRPRRRQIELIGTDGVITVEFASWDTCTVSTYRTATAEWTHEQIATKRDDMFAAEDLEFLQEISCGAPIRLTVEEAAKSVEVVALAQEDGKR